MNFNFKFLAVLIVLLAVFSGCGGGSGKIKETGDDGVSIKFSGVKTYYKDNRIEKEVTYVKGILVLADPGLRQMLDIKVFVDADADDRLGRVIERDIIERGEFTDGTFNRNNVTKITNSGGIGYLELSTGPDGNNGYVGIIAEYTTDYGNKNYIYKKVPIPYKDVQ